MQKGALQLLFCTLVVLAGAHQVSQHNSRIRLINGDLDTSNFEPIATLEGASPKELFLVQFVPPFNTKKLNALRADVDGKIFGYIPDNTVFLYSSAAEAARLQKEGAAHEVAWVGRLPHPHKQHPTLKSVTVPEPSTLEADVAPNTVHLRAMLVPGVFSHSELVEEVKAWEIDGATVTAVSGQTVMVSVPASGAAKAADAISARPEVIVVERRFPSHMNNRYAHGVMQSNDENSSPFWEAGIRGQNSVVGIGDSGIDVHRCSFIDGNVEPNFVSSPDKDLEDNHHRKIKGYWTLQDGIDANAGHGTHVTGTVAGEAHESSPDLKTLQKYNGGAHKARVIFTDIGCQTPEGCVCDDDRFCTARCPKKEMDGKMVRVCEDSARETWEPDDLTNFFPWSKKNGAFIHTNSWGEGTGHDVFSYYKAQTAHIDQFAWDNKDFLILFAAGNSGDSDGFYSIDPEGTAKNCLTVGASQTTNSGYQDVQEHLTDYDKKLDTARSFCTKEGIECPEFESQEKVCAAAKDNSGKGCKLLENQNGFTCNDLCKTTAVEAIKKQKEIYSQDNLAYFTSLGMTHDGRVKPDVTGPGFNIISTKGGDPFDPTKCGVHENAYDELQPMSGTSMATPNTAAHAVLVRQYFTDGFFPTGAPTKSNAFKPSAALMKAVLINSGRELQGLVKLGGGFHPVAHDAGSVPSLYQPPFLSANHGFGRVTLNGTLPLKHAPSCLNMVLATVNGADAVAEKSGDSFKRCFVAKSGLPLKVTLVYTDYPSIPNAAVNLVNDLDLKVTGEKNGNTILGNHLVDVQDDGTITTVPDRRNNVEQVYIKSPSTDLYCATVDAHRIVHGPQPFALVATGCDLMAVDLESII